MQAAIIAALVAAVVSLIGSFVNLRIAKQARDAALENSRLAAAIRLSEERVKLLKERNRDAEKLRIATWWLQIAVQRRSREEDEPLVKVDEAIDRFRVAFREFFDNWADAKDAIPDAEISAATREVRHTCKNDALDVLDAFKEYASPGGDVESSLKKLRRSLEVLREDLDDLLAIVIDVQMAEMKGVLFSDEGTESPWFASVSKRIIRRYERRARREKDESLQKYGTADQ